jgi:hypothetical protein
LRLFFTFTFHFRSFTFLSSLHIPHLLPFHIPPPLKTSADIPPPRGRATVFSKISSLFFSLEPKTVMPSKLYTTNTFGANSKKDVFFPANSNHSAKIHT